MIYYLFLTQRTAIPLREAEYAADKFGPAALLVEAIAEKYCAFLSVPSSFLFLAPISVVYAVEPIR
jgi:hypothetical protein